MSEDKAKIRELEAALARSEQSVKELTEAQRPTSDDMGRQITAHPGEPGYIHPECDCVSCTANRLTADGGDEHG